MKYASPNLENAANILSHKRLYVARYTSNNHSTRISYFSSPNITYRYGNDSEVNTGWEFADVRRAHMERKSNMSMWGDESGSCPGPSIPPHYPRTTTTEKPPCNDGLGKLCPWLEDWFFLCQWMWFRNLCTATCRDQGWW
jgi:hypothetical protein